MVSTKISSYPIHFHNIPRFLQRHPQAYYVLSHSSRAKLHNYRDIPLVSNIRTVKHPRVAAALKGRSNAASQIHERANTQSDWSKVQFTGKTTDMANLVVIRETIVKPPEEISWIERHLLKFRFGDLVGGRHGAPLAQSAAGANGKGLNRRGERVVRM